MSVCVVYVKAVMIHVGLVGDRGGEHMRGKHMSAMAYCKQWEGASRCLVSHGGHAEHVIAMLTCQWRSRYTAGLC